MAKKRVVDSNRFAVSRNEDAPLRSPKDQRKFASLRLKEESLGLDWVNRRVVRRVAPRRTW